MESMTAGDLVTVSGDGPPRDGIVFDLPSESKTVVAIMDARRGPGFRTVPTKALTERSEPGADDPALLRLIRRTPAPVHGRARAAGTAQFGQAGHSRPAGHRTTGK